MSNQFVYNRRNEQYWISGDGTRLLPEEMEDAHLINTIAYLERNVETFKKLHNLSILRRPAPSDLNGKFDNLKEIQKIIAMPAKQWMKQDFLIYKDMTNEYHRREKIRMEHFAADFHHVQSMHNLVHEHLANGSSEQQILRALEHMTKMVAASMETPSNDEDLYRAEAAKHFGIPYSQVTDNQRNYIKRYRYGKAYNLEPENDMPDYYR